MNRFYWLSMIFLLTLVGCRPQFVNHPRPEPSVDFTVFENVGCPPADQYGEYNLRECEADSPMIDLGCDSIRKLSGSYTKLDPSYLTAECVQIPSSPEELEQIRAENKYFHSEGGFFPIFTSYVIFRDGKFERITSKDEFKSLFAPITTPEEALSYALFMTDFSAGYELAYNPKYEYFVDEIEDTHVEEKDGKYLVHLFSYELFGCGPHETAAVVVEVTNQGQVKKVGSEAIFKDPAEDGLCVD